MYRLFLTFLLLPFTLSFSPKPEGPGGGHLDPKNVDVDKVFLLIDKSNYTLYLYEDVTLLKTYRVVFGNNDLKDKMMEGDRRTPEGTFHIVAKRYDKRWNRFLLLDYPTDNSRQKFEERKASHIIPASASIGGGIGIHGTWPNEGIVIDWKQNWTNGCISMKNSDVDELFKLVKVGTPVVIRR